MLASGEAAPHYTIPKKIRELQLFSDLIGQHNDYTIPKKIRELQLTACGNSKKTIIPYQRK